MEIFIIMIAWILGIIWGLYLKISIVFFFILMLIIILLLILYYKLNKNKKIYIRKYIILFLIAFIVSNMQITILENSFEEKYKNLGNSENEVEIIGTVVSNPNKKEYKTQYVLEIDKINNDETYKNTKILLNVKKEINQLEYGNQIHMYAVLETPTIQRNEGGFDYKQYLKTEGIYKIVTIEENNIKIVKTNNISIIYKIINIVKKSIKEQITKNITGEEGNLLNGILIGDKNNIDKSVIEDFSNSSLSHVLAISGMHVSYIIMGIGFIVSKIKIGKNFSKIITILFIIFFMLLTGKTPSVERACIMSIYMILSSLLHRKNIILGSLSISMLVILIENPYSIMDIGLQLSYGGTIGIIFIYPILKKYINEKTKFKIKNIIKNKSMEKLVNSIIDIILITISANIIIFPIMLYHFNTISLTFIISNLLVSPIIGIIILLGIVSLIISYIFPLLSILLLKILKIFLSLLLFIAHIIGNLPFSIIYLTTPKLYIIVVYYIILIYFILTKNQIIKITIYEKIKKIINTGINKKIDIKNKKAINKKIIFLLIIILIITIIFYLLINKIKNGNNELEIYFIDVGQGDSTLIITPNKKNILIDGGGTLERDIFDIGEKTLLPYLLDRGIIRLDYILISHFDSDHIRWNFNNIRKNRSKASYCRKTI